MQPHRPTPPWHSHKVVGVEQLQLVAWPRKPQVSASQSSGWSASDAFEYRYIQLTKRLGSLRFAYEEAPYFLRFLLHIQVAQLSCRTAVISCLAAARVHGIPTLNREHSTVVELNLPGHGKPSSTYPEIFHYRCAYLPESDITVVNGYRVTTIERTFVDICAVNGALEGLAFIEAALRRGFRKWQFQMYLDSHRGRWGITKAQEVLDQALYGIDSVHETHARYVIMTCLPQLSVSAQVVFYTLNSYYRVDLLIADSLILEVDGRDKYAGPDRQARQVYRKQIAREQFLLDLGYHVARIHPDEIATKLVNKVAFLTNKPSLDRHVIVDLYHQPPWWQRT